MNRSKQREQKKDKGNLCFILLKSGPMHPLYQKAAGLTEAIIAAAIEVHRDKGPGLIESIYEWWMLKELGLRGLGCISQKMVVIEYKGFTREEPLRFDVLVGGCVLVEAKARFCQFTRLSC